MTTYAPNAFQGQSAQAGALRSYAPNPFTGTNPGGVTKMAPHLSVAAADRPLAADVTKLQEAGFGDQMPNLDQMWRLSPNTYQDQVSAQLRRPQAAAFLAGPGPGLEFSTGAGGKLNRDAYGFPIYQQGAEDTTRYRYDDDGNIIGTRNREAGGSDE